MNPWLRDFETALVAQVTRQLPADTELSQAVLYSIQTPGKRIRPLLVRESSAIAGLAAEPSQLLQFSVELIHTFSLVHDDLPCLDNDDFRRGQPTVHRKFGEAQALLAGDLLLQLGIRTLLDAERLVPAASFYPGLRCILDAIGGNGLIGGQSREVEMLERMTDAELLSIQDRKTTALFRASILSPFLWAGTPEEDSKFRDALEYANAFGFAFQIADDLEDAEQDAASGSKNVLSIYGKTEAKRRAVEALKASRFAPHYSATDFLLQKLASES